MTEEEFELKYKQAENNRTAFLIEVASMDSFKLFFEQNELELVNMGDGTAAQALSWKGARQTVKRIMLAPIEWGDRQWRNFEEWLCDRDGGNWCELVARLGYKGAINALREMIRRRPIRISAGAIGLFVEPISATTLFILGSIVGEFDDACQCDLQGDALPN